jgi:Uma2 family endonuclease
LVSVFPLHRYTFADYLRLEEESSTRHEFLDGEIVAMAGGTPEHAALAMAVGWQLRNQLADGRCRIFSSDLRVRVAATGLTTYPDVSVICGRTERDPASPSTVTNPTAVVEVTSDSTEDYDRGSKLEHYQMLPSIRTIVIVSHREPRIDVWTRTDGGFEHSSALAGGRALLPALAAELDVDTLYAAASEPEV